MLVSWQHLGAYAGVVISNLHAGVLLHISLLLSPHADHVILYLLLCTSLACTRIAEIPRARGTTPHLSEE